MRSAVLLSLYVVSFLLGINVAVAEEVENTKSFNDFFTASPFSQLTLSPDGKLVAFEESNYVKVGVPGNPYHNIIDIKRSFILTGIWWSGDYTLILGLYEKSNGNRSFYAIELAIDDEYKDIRIRKEAELQHDGFIVDKLVDQGDKILFAKRIRDKDSSYTTLHYVSLFDKESRFLKRKTKISPQNYEIDDWIVNDHMQPVAGISYSDEETAIWYKKGDARRLYKIWSGPANLKIAAYKLGADQKSILVTTDYQSDMKYVTTFDLETSTFSPPVVSNERSDIAGIIVNTSNLSPIAASYFEKGKIHYNFFDSNAEKQYQKLSEQHPESEILIREFQTENNKALVRIRSSIHAGVLTVCDFNTSECTNVGSLYPTLDNIELAKTYSISVTSKDNLVVDSFLTMPAQKQNDIPLIVMPHGGPIGVSDNIYFSSDKQWLAYNGYAVLQVNYRGSEGYGKEFKNKGMKQFGQGIEDDIEAALAYVLESYPSLSKTDICLFGGSYGGYSAIFSVIRSPEKYKCAASFAGVTDLSLLFNRSNVWNNDTLSENLKEMIGDPETQIEQLKTYSPVYQYKRINTPLFLAHGTDDHIVDVEHGWRMHLLLKLRKFEHEWHLFNGIGHSFETISEANKLYDNLLPFLDKHLKSEDEN